MANAEEIQNQQKLLATQRRTLAHYLYQRAQLGSAHEPPGVSNGIAEAREHIVQIKATLRGWGVSVDDLPGDDATQPVPLPTPILPFWQSHASAVRLGVIVLLLALVVGVSIWLVGHRRPGSTSVNIAPLGSVSVSSVSTSVDEDCQRGEKAVDGIISGYPENPCNEWASDGELKGAWLKIEFDMPHKIDKIVLFDRPTPDEQILEATIQLNDGTTIKTGQLPDEGGPKEFPIEPKTVTSIKVTVKEARGAVIGLSEIQVFGQ